MAGSHGLMAENFFGNERVARARILPILNLYADRPAPPQRRGETLFELHRLFQGRTELHSPRFPGFSGLRDAPRVLSLCFGPGRGDYRNSCRRCATIDGPPIAEIALFFAEGYFSTKSRIRDLLTPHEQFDRLAFLGHGNELVPGGYESWYNHYTHISDIEISGTSLPSPQGAT